MRKALWVVFSLALSLFHLEGASLAKAEDADPRQEDADPRQDEADETPVDATTAEPEPEAPAPTPEAVEPEADGTPAAALATPAPVPPPAAVQEVRVEASEPTHDSAPPARPSLYLEGSVGAVARLDGGPDGFATREPFDLALSLGAWSGGREPWSLGVELQRAGLGHARTAAGVDSTTVHYDLDTLWAKARHYLGQGPQTRGYLGLGLGLSLEEIRATGTRTSTVPFNAPPEVFACSTLIGPTVSLGAGAGVETEFERRWLFLLQLDGTVQPVTSKVVGGCAVGSGSVATAQLRVGFAYGLGSR